MSVLKEFSEVLPQLSFCYLIGGDKIDYDLERIREKGANVVVATPGRLFDISVDRQALSFRKLEVLIMDEADKLLIQGQEVHLSSILSTMPKQRRTGLFSATMPS
jgi:superfamily II DNA/RNA helicase